MSQPVTTGHAFISYVHEDEHEVDRLEAFLSAAGIQVWRDRNELWPGDEWKIEIRRAIQRNALAFIACFSPASLVTERTYQNEELNLAAEEYRLRQPGRPWLFPVRFGDVDLPPFDLGAGKTLDALQRTDLFGEAREPNLGRLAMSIGRVLSIRAERSPAEPSGSKAVRVNDEAVNVAEELTLIQLLRDPNKDIELDDRLTALADQTRQACLDPVRFPTSAAELGEGNSSAARFVARRVREYWAITANLAETVALGCAWSRSEQLGVFTRAMKVIGNTTPMEGGQQLLLELRAYPRIIVMYAGAHGAVARENYPALRAITTGPTMRRDGRAVPLINECNIWSPFSTAEWIGSVVARDADDQVTTDEEIEGFTRRSGGRKTPVSDDLHTRLRQVVRRLLPGDEDYDEAFDRAEMLLGLIAEDSAAVVEAAGGYAHGGWVGRYAWRSHYSGGGLEAFSNEAIGAGDEWPPLRAGLFGGSAERVRKAIDALEPRATSQRFW